MAESTPQDSAGGGWQFPRGPLIACYVLLGGLLVWVLVARYLFPLYLAEPIGVERAAGNDIDSDAEAGLTPIPVADGRIDPNTATWVELTRLPGIGEVTAKRIVAYREERRTAPGQPVFTSAESLASVKGIGPKTVEAIRDHLTFPQTVPAAE
ncbi:MAG: helix-hairpin-helix domain-containing protein [Planctomycetes bacterium]|nr:helix-hairpin-helix domain-containing protein [Planctomycetota bacterium]